jgi:hypothetical protein
MEWVEPAEGSCEHGNESSFHKLTGHSSAAAHLEASREGLSFLHLVSGLQAKLIGGN